jgi:hypothetical protein
MHVPGRAGREQAYLKFLVLQSLGTSYNHTNQVRCANATGKANRPLPARQGNAQLLTRLTGSSPALASGSSALADT